MKNITLTIYFDTDKLDALNYHMGKKDMNLQSELSDYVQKLYVKHVPQSTREYIDDRLSRKSVAKSIAKRPARSGQTNNSTGSTV